MVSIITTSMNSIGIAVTGQYEIRKNMYRIVTKK